MKVDLFFIGSFAATQWLAVIVRVTVKFTLFIKR
jgi:hypothetical protein